MVVKIIGIIIGVMVLGAGLYYRAREKDDPQSRKIYGVIAAVGAAVAVIAALLLFI